MVEEEAEDTVEGEVVERVTTSLKINPKLWKRVKKEAVEREIKLYELVEEALEKEIGVELNYVDKKVKDKSSE